MVRFRGWTVLTFLAACCQWSQVTAQSDCLTSVDVIPAAQRMNINISGRSMPIGFSGPTWDSAKLYSKIAEIITKEILGFNTQMGPHGDESHTSYKLVAEGTSIHFLNEIWSSFSAEIVVFDQANPDKALPLLKNLDYSGRDGIFIFPKSFQPYYETYGKSLEFYQYFNASVVKRLSDFSQISAFDLAQLSNCDDPEGGAEIEKTYYLQVTGDTAAMSNGNWVCHQQKWWLSPACRADPTTCVPLLTKLFWGWSEMRQKAAFFNLPIALASTTSDATYLQWPKDNKMLAYWWMPDDRFIADGAIQMFFPDYNPQEWAVGNKVTTAVSEPLYSYYKPGVDSAAPKVFLLMQSMTLFDDDMIRLLNDVVAAQGQGVTDYIDHVACNWLKNNGLRWRQWIPIATECTRSLGFGMVADDGTFVQDRSLASGCSLCTPGKFASSYSDDVGQSAVCLDCPSGSAQDRGGQTECVACSAGTYRVETGIRCSPCGKGTYQTLGAQDSCLSCTAPMTTVTVGSDTQDLCICPAATYRPCYDVDNNGQLRTECQCSTGFYTQSSSRCIGCPEGMVCEEGSDEQFFPCEPVEIVNSTVNPYPKPEEGYFVLLEQPTWVFKCIDLLSCPGGQAQNCGTGLRGIACGACDAGFYKQAGSCNQCGEFEQSPLFLIIPGLISPAFVFVFYKVSLADVHLWGRTGQGFGGIGYLLLVYVQTVSVIISVFPTLPATLVGGIGWTSTSAEITSLFRLECAGPSDFVGSFILNLVLPQIAGLIFFFTWLGALLISRFVPKIRMDGDVVLGCFGAILKTFFVTVASKCFSLFQCYNHPNGRLSMRASPEVLQGSEEWSSMVIFAAMAILVNCVLLLVVISWAMWVAPQRFHLKSFRMRWKFMIQKMRPSVYWWMMTIFFKGLWISLTGVLFTNAMQQSLWVCFGLLFYTTISYVFLPWRSVFVTILDIGTHVSTLLLCLLLPFLITFEKEEQEAAVAIFVSLAVCGFLSVVAAISWAFIKGFSPWWRRRRERQIEYYAQRMADVFSAATEPRLLAEMMTEIPALDILEIKYGGQNPSDVRDIPWNSTALFYNDQWKPQEVATMMSAEILGKHVIGRLDWGEPALTKAVEDKFVDGVARSQVIWT